MRKNKIAINKINATLRTLKKFLIWARNNREYDKFELIYDRLKDLKKSGIISKQELITEIKNNSPHLTWKKYWSCDMLIEFINKNF